MRRIILTALLLAVTATFTHAAELKVGHFDLQRLVALSEAGKDAREKYLARAKKYQDEINTRTEKLKGMKEGIESDVKKLKENEKPSAKLLEREKEYSAQFRDFQRLLGGYQDELKVYDAELTRKVLEELTPVVRDFARTNKYDYLFKNGEGLVFGSEKRDVTEELVKEFNKARK